MMTAQKAIRAKCLDCANGSATEVRHCPIKDCPLYPYRFGMRPDTAEKRGKAIGPEEESQKWG